MPVTAFLCGYWIPADLLRLCLHEVAAQISDLNLVRTNCGDLAVVKEDHFTRVRKDRGNVRGNEMLTIAQSDNERWPLTGSDNFLRIVYRHRSDGVDSSEVFKGSPNSAFQFTLEVLGDQMDDCFCVGISNELMTRCG